MSGWRQKRETMQHYNVTAKSYDELYAAEQRVKIEKALEKVRIPNNSLILDGGCGTGLLFEYVADKAQLVVGIDISRRILEEAKKRAKKFGNVHLVLADADRQPFRDGVFSHVFTVTLLQNMPNPEKTLIEFKRVAVENALFVITGLKKKFSRSSFEFLLRKLKLSVMEIVDGNAELKCYVALCVRDKR
ncbi:MAG: class I SAM-dependent methyltransferase [Nitrososphaerota archaeon]|nr:class I SAM-dependent methyltransferase [Nitrososphaerota archaeon]